MSRRKALRWLYSRHRWEWDFGWHDPRPETRRWYRELYPIDYVAAYLRGDPADVLLAAHRLRLEAIHGVGK